MSDWFAMPFAVEMKKISAYRRQVLKIQNHGDEVVR
jgi:hypothetical protein